MLCKNGSNLRMDSKRKTSQWCKVIIITFIIFVIYGIIAVVALYLRSKNNLNILSDVFPSRHNYKQLSLKRDIEMKTSNCQITKKNVCKVVCSNMGENNITDAINQLNFEVCYSSDIRLSIKDVSFDYGNISTGWLKKVTKNVVRLDINSPSLRALGDGSFSGSPFSLLRTVEIDSNKMLFIRKNTFWDSRIQNLIITTDISVGVTFGFDALGYLFNDLREIQLRHALIDPQHILHLTGPKVTILKHLKVMDLRENQISTLYEDSFIAAPELETLWLADNYLKSIDGNAFRGISKHLSMLGLENNQLTTLPEGLFNGFTGTGVIRINNNPWICDCKIEWFRKFYLENIINYFENGAIPFNCKIGHLPGSFCHTTSLHTSQPTTFSATNNISSSSTSILQNNTTNEITTESTINKTSAISDLSTTLSTSSTFSSSRSSMLTSPLSSSTATGISTRKMSSTTTTSQSSLSTKSSSTLITSLYPPTTISVENSTILNHSTTSDLTTTNSVNLSTTTNKNIETTSTTVTNLTTIVHVTTPADIISSKSNNLVSISTKSDDDDYYDDDDDVDCINSFRKNYTLRSNSRIYSHEIFLKNGSVLFEFYHIDNTPFFEVKIHGCNGSQNIVWFVSNDQRINGCISKIYSGVELNFLEYSKIYTLCLREKATATVDPFACTSLPVPPDWDHTPWIFNKYKVFCITSGVSLIIFVIMFVSCFIICLIKRSINSTNTDEKEINQSKHFIPQKKIYNVSSPSSGSDGYVSPISKNVRKLSIISERDSENCYSRKRSF